MRGVSGGKPHASAMAGTSIQYQSPFLGLLSGTKPLLFSLALTTPTTSTCTGRMGMPVNVWEFTLLSRAPSDSIQRILLLMRFGRWWASSALRFLGVGDNRGGRGGG